MQAYPPPTHTHTRYMQRTRTAPGIHHSQWVSMQFGGRDAWALTAGVGRVHASEIGYQNSALVCSALRTVACIMYIRVINTTYAVLTTDRPNEAFHHLVTGLSHQSQRFQDRLWEKKTTLSITMTLISHALHSSKHVMTRSTQFR